MMPIVVVLIRCAITAISAFRSVCRTVHPSVCASKTNGTQWLGSRVSPPVYTLLGWHGMAREAKEHTMWLLSSVDHLNDLERRIDELHPSDNPILLILPLSEVSSPVATIVTGSWQED